VSEARWINESLMTPPRWPRLVLRALFVEPDAIRLQSLRSVSQGLDLDSWHLALQAWEMHGLLPLSARNLTLAGAELPGEAERALRAAESRLHKEAGRASLTCALLLDAAARAGVEVVLLKGASLLIDIYPELRLRNAGDVDVWVKRRSVPALLAALKGIGLIMKEHQLPSWWYRWFHFHLKLHPAVALLSEVEVHSALHDEALLLTASEVDLWRRRVAVKFLGRRAFALDPLDRLLHLSTHLVSHWHGIPGEPDAALLERVLYDRSTDVRLKWVLDVHAATEKLATVTRPQELLARAIEWGAPRELWFALRLAQSGLGFGPGKTLWVETLLDVLSTVLPSGTVTALTSSHHDTSTARTLPDSASRHPPAPAAGRSTPRPLPLLDIRARTLARLPRLLAPPLDYIRRRYCGGRANPVREALVWTFHLVLALSRVVVAALLFPVALLGRELLRRRRRAELQLALSPDNILDLTAAARSLPADSSPPMQQKTQGGSRRDEVPP